MEKNPLAGKVALVTGAAKRVGAEIARELHTYGMNIILHYNASEEDAAQLCNELNHVRKQSAIPLQADLQVPENDKSLIKKAVGEWNRLDLLVNNASRFYRTYFGKVTEYAWDDLMMSNLKAPFFLSQSAAPFLKENNGLIINITDTYAMRPLKDYSVYCMSKGGLVVMTKILAHELAPHVRVNAISPGVVLWPEGKNELSNEEKQKIIDKIALKKIGSAQDIAKAVLFFVRDAGYVTGQVLDIDGGRFT